MSFNFSSILIIFKYLVLLVFQSRQVLFYFNRPQTLSAIRFKGRTEARSSLNRIRSEGLAKQRSDLRQTLAEVIALNVFVYGQLRWLATKLIKENEPEEIPKEFPSRREPSN